jgi:hypothetical protein
MTAKARLPRSSDTLIGDRISETIAELRAYLGEQGRLTRLINPTKFAVLISIDPNKIEPKRPNTRAKVTKNRSIQNTRDGM